MICFIKEYEIIQELHLIGKVDDSSLAASVASWFCRLTRDNLGSPIEHSVITRKTARDAAPYRVSRTTDLALAVLFSLYKHVITEKAKGIQALNAQGSAFISPVAQAIARGTINLLTARCPSPEHLFVFGAMCDLLPLDDGNGSCLYTDSKVLGHLSDCKSWSQPKHWRYALSSSYHPENDKDILLSIDYLKYNEYLLTDSNSDCYFLPHNRFVLQVINDLVKLTSSM